MGKKTLGIYQSCICQIGGVETFLYNFCWWIRNFFDVTVVYGSANESQLKRLKKLVNVINYKDKEKFEFDIVIRNSVWGEICHKICSKENRYIEMRHANYKYLIEKGLLYQQYFTWEKTNEIVGCGEFVSKMSDEVLHDHPTTIKNILLPNRETNKVLHLISCTRLDSAKGWHRMLKMMAMMRNARIKFEWNIFTNAPMKCEYEEVRFWHYRYDIWDYLADADYTVLLSDSEGLPYTVQESLQYKVPCIVTDVGGCTELIKDGINGYVVPLDMDFNINKIKNIPICKEYDNHALEDWLNYLGYKGKIDKQKIIEEFEEEKEKMVRVKALIRFKDMEANVERQIGDEFEVEVSRAEYLKENEAVEIIGQVQEEKLVAEPKEEPKKTTKKKTSKK